MFHEGIHQYYHELHVVLQERAKHIYLGPRSSAKYPFLWIFERKKYIVKMDIDAGTEGWEYFEEDVIHVAINLADMRRIYEENVIRFKFFKFCQGNILQAVRNDGYPVLVIVRDQRQHEIRVGFDKRGAD